LETLRGDPGNPFEEPPHWMAETAWRASGTAMFDFVSRASQNFPRHAAVPQIATPVKGVRESWYLAAIAAIANAPGAGDLTKALKYTRELLLPHARSDRSAAHALA